MVTAKSRKPQRRINNILLIEDEDDTRQVVQSLLLDEGYCVRTAMDRDEAIQHLNCALFQVILMDLCMPGRAASDFVQSVRKTSPASEIVLVTAAANAPIAASALGLDYCIGKPLMVDDLLGLLERLETT